MDSNNNTSDESLALENNLLSGPALQGSTPSKVKNGSPCPRTKCIPWPENELAAHVTHDLHRKRPVTLYNDRSGPESAWAHSMTYNPSLLSCKIEIDNKMLYWFPCLHGGWLFKTAHVHVWILTTVTTVSASHTVTAAHVCVLTRIYSVLHEYALKPTHLFLHKQLFSLRQVQCFLHVAACSGCRRNIPLCNQCDSVFLWSQSCCSRLARWLFHKVINLWICGISSHMRLERKQRIGRLF